MTAPVYLLAGLGAHVFSAMGITRLNRWTRKLEVTQSQVLCPRLGPGWDNLRVALLSDLHFGHIVTADYLSQVVELTNAQRCDLICLAGDFVSRTDDACGKLVEILSKLQAPMGAIAVLGNHDYYGDHKQVQKALQEAGIEVLIDANRLFEREGQPLAVVGLADLWQRDPDIHRAFAGCDGPDTARVVLCHNPDTVELLGEAPPPDLVLAGHTHGGQIRLPFAPRWLLPVKHSEFLAGLADTGDYPIYVSRGVGVVGLPARWRCPPEVAVLTLRSGVGNRA